MLLNRVTLAIVAVIGCAGGRPSVGQTRADSSARKRGVSYVPLERICRKALCDDDLLDVSECDCQARYVPAQKLPTRDITAGVEWILKNGHRVQDDMPVLTGSVYIVGSSALRGHAFRVQTLADLQRLAREKGERLHYIQVTAEREDVIIHHARRKSVRARLLNAEFGFEPSGGLGAVGTCGFALYRQRGRLIITETGGCVVR